MSTDKDANDGKHLCIDSSFYQPGGTWSWTYGTSTITTVYPTWVNSMAGGPAHVDGSGFCYLMYKVLNQPPDVYNGGTCPGSITYTAPTLTQGHCTAFQYQFQACDPEGDAITGWQIAAGDLGAISASGLWTFANNAQAPGTYTIHVSAKDAGSGVFGAVQTLNVVVTNATPVLTGQCGATITTSQNSPTPAAFAATDADACDVLAWTFTANTVPAGAVATLTNVAGALTFKGDKPGDYIIDVAVTDGVNAPQTCQVTFHVLEGSLNSVTIEKVEDAIQGKFWTVGVSLSSIDPALALGGFDFLIAYDNSALSLQGVATGAIYTDCKWEYFTYRFGANGNCSGGCPSGLVRVIGLAETNNGAAHPTANCQISKADGGKDLTGENLFVMTFLVSNNRTYECQYVPIRFYWVDCGDNTLSSYDGSKLILEKTVWDYSGSSAQPYVLDSNLAGFPGYAGIPSNVCGENAQLPGGKTPPKRDIDFYNGGIDIICADSIDARGDINLNGLANEVADAVMFTNYFIKGLNAFGTHVEGSIAASDVNADGITLTVADLVYLIRVIVGDALPYAKDAIHAASSLTTTVTNDGGMLAVTDPMGGAALVVSGEVKPVLMANNVDMTSFYDGQNTHIVVVPSMNVRNNAGFTGNFINVMGSKVLSIDLSTPSGETVAAKLAPKSFALNQNYPNPFNPTTTISFALPTASQYTLTIYNVTGQSVAEFTGAAEAGVKSIEWNASMNASGVYFYKLTAGNYTSTKKMVLLK